MSKIVQPDYSIIVALYNEESIIEHTFSQLYEKVILENQDKKGEIVFVDDGSHDRSLEKLIGIRKKHPDIVRIVKFSRNFGQAAATHAGYENARGKCIARINADLQDPPELINQMLYHFFEKNYQIVIAKRKTRKESYYRKITSKFSYNLVRKMCFSEIPKGGFDFFLISSKVRDLITLAYEKNPYIQGQIMWQGFEKKYIEYERIERKVGKSKWNFSMKIKYLIDSIISYSFFPIRFITYTGVIMIGISFIYAIIELVRKLSGLHYLMDNKIILFLIVFISGIHMIMLGIVGEYLWRVLEQIRNRPLYIVDKIYE